MTYPARKRLDFSSEMSTLYGRDTYLIEWKAQPEDEPGERAAVEHLPAQGHGHIAAPGVHPHAKAGLFKQDGCHQAHDRAHDGDDHQGDGIGDELRPVCGAHKGKGQRSGQFFHDKELQDAGNRDHDGHFMQSHEKGGVGHAARVQGNIVWQWWRRLFPAGFSA